MPNQTCCLSSSYAPSWPATASPPGPSSGPYIGTPFTAKATDPLSGAIVHPSVETLGVQLVSFEGFTGIV